MGRSSRSRMRVRANPSRIWRILAVCESVEALIRQCLDRFEDCRCTVQVVGDRSTFGVSGGEQIRDREPKQASTRCGTANQRMIDQLHELLFATSTIVKRSLIRAWAPLPLVSPFRGLFHAVRDQDYGLDGLFRSSYPSGKHRVRLHRQPLRFSGLFPKALACGIERFVTETLVHVCVVPHGQEARKACVRCGIA